MPFDPLAVVLALAAGLTVALLTWPVRAGLVRYGVYDAPNSRSSHAGIKPRGGGIAVLLVVLPAWLAASLGTPALPDVGALILLTIGLAALSLADDIRGVSVAVRLPAQAAAVVAGLVVLGPGPVFQGWLPAWLDVTLAGLAWLWFVNLYNFMDGIDGITGVETLAICLGLGVVGWLHAGIGSDAWALLTWLLAGAAAGFLVWNWAPAKVFLGDVGSVPLGFLIGMLLLDAASAGLWAPAVILPGYYLMDATVTLLRRLLRGEKVWHAHREHAYQRAVQAGASHAAVAGSIGGLNVVLIGCAVWSTRSTHGWPETVALAGTLAFWLGLQLWWSVRQRRS